MIATYTHIRDVNSREEKALFKIKDITGKGTNGYRLAINSFRMQIKRPLTVRELTFRSQILRRVEERKCTAISARAAGCFMRWWYVVAPRIKA